VSLSSPVGRRFFTARISASYCSRLRSTPCSPPHDLRHLTGGIDLSVGSILAAADAGLIVSKFPDLGRLWLPAAVLTGLVFGVINGALIALLRLPPFIVTLGSLTACAVWRASWAPIHVFNPSVPYAFIGNGSLTLLPGVVSIPWLSVIALLVILASWLVLRRTVLGCISMRSR